MRNLLALVAVGLTLALGACSSAPTIDAEQWEPTGDDYSRVDCGYLLPEWGTGEEEAPVACWTFEETHGLPDRFSDLVGDMIDHAGAEPIRGPGCASHTVCNADWEDGGGYMTLSAGVTLIGLQAHVDAGTRPGPDEPQLHELTLWTSDDLTMSDEDWSLYFNPGEN